jgi:hypothetical protein
LEITLVIDNAFDLVIYTVYVVIVIFISIILVPALLKKLKEGFIKYGWKKFPKNFVDPYFGSTVLELMVVICFMVFFSGWLIYGFFDHRLEEIISYFQL